MTDEGYGEYRELEFDEELYSVGAGSNLNGISRASGGWLQHLHHARSGVRPRHRQWRTMPCKSRAPVLGEFDADDYVQHREGERHLEHRFRCRSSLARTSPRACSHVVAWLRIAEASMDPSFSVARLSLLDSGIVFVVAHVRGGGEMGRHWQTTRARRCRRRTPSPTSSLPHSISSTPDVPHRSIWSPTAAAQAALLMGAVANLAPELFNGILANVPPPTHSPSIRPVAAVDGDRMGRVGNPLADKEVYDYMKSYSPYENVEAKGLPVDSRDHVHQRHRVLYVEPAKWLGGLMFYEDG